MLISDKDTWLPDTWNGGKNQSKRNWPWPEWPWIPLSTRQSWKTTTSLHFMPWKLSSHQQVHLRKAKKRTKSSSILAIETKTDGKHVIFCCKLWHFSDSSFGEQVVQLQRSKTHLKWYVKIMYFHIKKRLLCSFGLSWDWEPVCAEGKAFIAEALRWKVYWLDTDITNPCSCISDYPQKQRQSYLFASSLFLFLF